MNHSAPSTAAANAVPPQPKPIRFVTNHDGPYAKRRRINSACLTCRRKKTRCSGERPICGTCTQNKHECGGYGPETDSQNTPISPTIGAPKNAPKKPLRRESVPAVIPVAPKPKIEPDAQPVRPKISHTMSTNSVLSNDSDVSVHAHKPGIEREDDRDRQTLSLATRNRMPYFRYFGPTAIMPGFKQMVVKIRGKQHGTGHTSSDGMSKPPIQS